MDEWIFILLVFYRQLGISAVQRIWIKWKFGRLSVRIGAGGGWMLWANTKPTRRKIRFSHSNRHLQRGMEYWIRPYGLPDKDLVHLFGVYGAWWPWLSCHDCIYYFIAWSYVDGLQSSLINNFNGFVVSNE